MELHCILQSMKNTQSNLSLLIYKASAIPSNSHRSFKTPVKIIRPFNTFGPRQSMRAVIPTIINQVLNKKIKKIELGDISTKRDYYVDDVSSLYDLIKLNKFGRSLILEHLKVILLKILLRRFFT